ncbi:hypothetical protein [Microbispora sp. H11081]|uniref:hypothetical protein n=1 Tax=Microbispora sp. H11081 TaxID=2729107 RepID=UPI0014734AA4|nr:hypothetical protein [Microbispora sp. H11081]
MTVELPPSGRRPRRRIAVGVIGLVAFLLAGLGAYAVARHDRLQDTKYCGHDCVPGIGIGTVVEALQGRGHTCVDNRQFWSCRLSIGRVRFEADLFRSVSGADFSEYISKVEARIVNPDSTTAAAGLDYTSWFAALPHRDDPSTAEKVRGWLTEQITGDGDVTFIMDWEYTLEREANTRSVELTMSRRH